MRRILAWADLKVGPYVRRKRRRPKSDGEADLRKSDVEADLRPKSDVEADLRPKSDVEADLQVRLVIRCTAMTRLDYPTGPLHDVMRATAARVPDRPAITFKDRTMTFGAFDRESNRLANGLARLGLGSGDRVALYLPNCPQYELAFYAACKLGAVSSPMNPSYREREITYQVNDAGASVLVTH